jgi:hypothetical protein
MGGAHRANYHVRDSGTDADYIVPSRDTRGMHGNGILGGRKIVDGDSRLLAWLALIRRANEGIHRHRDRGSTARTGM